MLLHLFCRSVVPVSVLRIMIPRLHDTKQLPSPQRSTKKPLCNKCPVHRKKSRNTSSSVPYHMLLNNGHVTWIIQKWDAQEHVNNCQCNTSEQLHNSARVGDMHEKKSSRLFTNKPGVHISPLQGVISISRLHSCQGCAACPRWTRCLWKFKVVKRYASKVEMLRNNQTRKVFCNRVMVTPPDAQACFKRSKVNIELRWHGNSPGSQLSQPFKQSVRSVRLKLQRFQRMNNSHGCDRDADWRPWCRVATMFTSKTWGTHPKADLDEPVIING